MTAQERAKITKRMLWIIPAMLLCIIGDYCMGLEPKDSVPVSFMISTGWLTIADWRIALSHIGGLIGTALYSETGHRGSEAVYHHQRQNTEMDHGNRWHGGHCRRTLRDHGPDPEIRRV